MTGEACGGHVRPKKDEPVRDHFGALGGCFVDGDAEQRQRPPGRALDDPDTAARQPRIDPQHPRITAGARPQPFQDLDRRRLACAVRAEQAEDLAPLNLEIDALDRLE